MGGGGKFWFVHACDLLACWVCSTRSCCLLEPSENALSSNRGPTTHVSTSAAIRILGELLACCCCFKGLVIDTCTFDQKTTRTIVVSISTCAA